MRSVCCLSFAMSIRSIVQCFTISSAASFGMMPSPPCTRASAASMSRYFWVRFSSDHTWRIGSALKMSPNMAESMIVEGIVETLDVGIGSGPDLLRMNAQLSAEAAGVRESETWKGNILSCPFRQFSINQGDIEWRIARFLSFRSRIRRCPDVGAALVIGALIGNNLATKRTITRVRPRTMRTGGQPEVAGHEQGSRSPGHRATTPQARSAQLQGCG